MSKVFIEETSLSAIGDAIRAKTGKSDLLSPAQMVTAIGSITGGGSGGGVEIEPIVLTGDCSYMCGGSIAAVMIDNFPDKISTEEITNATNMFYRSNLESIPFDINMASTSYAAMTKMFQNCAQLKQLPTINNGYPSSLGSIFYGCSNLERIPDSYGNWDFSRLNSQTSADCGNIFAYCPKLRYVPKTFLQKFQGKHTSYSYSYYNSTFNGCYSLDEVRGLGVSPATLTTNIIRGTFDMCTRLKAITFNTNEDGSPIVANWKNQSIDLSSNIGAELITYSWYEPDRNYTMGKEKWIKDEASYQALKNDPDAFVGTYELSTAYLYSRYNKVSALETIQSLPDCLAAGGTNTIKFRGISGANTDGGAINTLTEEEIAVATAKGWTVTFI